MQPKPIIILAGLDDPAPEWLVKARATLDTAYSLRAHSTRAGYVSRLTDDRAALVLVDGDRDDWAFWTATPKSSPATRRIPVFLIASQPDALRDAARRAGADQVIDPATFSARAGELVAAHARVFDPARAEQLDCDCQQPLPPLAEQGVAQFNAGEFYRQHDLFEELWMATEGPVRDLYRAILQVGVAYYQILRGNHRGARKMLMRSVQWLAVLPDQCQGIDVAALREDSYRVRAALEALPEDAIDQFDRALLQPVKRIPPDAE
ncbi:MAG: DUF309 domain-containing protein [Chloroflexota bacterium]